MYGAHTKVAVIPTTKATLNAPTLRLTWPRRFLAVLARGSSSEALSCSSTWWRSRSSSSRAGGGYSPLRLPCDTHCRSRRIGPGSKSMSAARTVCMPSLSTSEHRFTEHQTRHPHPSLASANDQVQQRRPAERKPTKPIMRPPAASAFCSARQPLPVCSLFFFLQFLKR